MPEEIKTDGFTIDPDKWEPFSSAKKPPSPEIPIWVKMDNGRIALAAWTNTGYVSGYMAVSYDTDKGFVISSTTGYMLRNASWQPCKFFNP